MSRWWNDWLASRTPLPEKERRRSRREIFMLGATAVLFIVVAVIEIRLPNVTNSTSMLGHVLFFLLINVNLILLGLLGFLVMRSLVRLGLERRRGVFGSRLRTRLVVAFLGLSLVPSVLLFFVAQGFLNAAFETWFNVRVEAALDGSMDVADRYYELNADKALHFASQVAEALEQDRLLEEGLGPDEPSYFDAFAERKCEQYALSALRVVDGGGKQLGMAQQADLGTLPNLKPSMLADVLGGRKIAETQRFQKGDLVRVGVPVFSRTRSVVGAVVIDSFVPRDISRMARRTARSYQEYRQLLGMRQPIENQYILSLALITLVIIFSAIWFGLRQAKSITVPLQRLEEGTREVAHGNWSYRIEASGEEETAILVDSFNRMTADLQEINSELVERRKYAESILANIAAGVVSLSARGTVTMVNPAAEQMLGLRLSAQRGKPWSEVFDRADLAAVADMIEQMFRRPDQELERQIELSGGEQALRAHVTGTALTSETGEPRGVMLFFENVTDLQRVQRMEAWREVARRLAHEIKNPLTPIQLSAQRLRKRYLEHLADGERPVFDECTRTIIAQVDELKRLVDEFSTFARLPAARLVPQDLNSVVDEALILFRQGHPNIEFVFRAGDLPPVELDRDSLKRALINMLDNAVAACQGEPHGPGRIEASTRYSQERGVVHLEIADNGCGMSRDVKLRLFEPYFSTKKDGTGLGLAIVSTVVADHQAYIRAQANQPYGTRFVITFPIRHVPAVERLAAQA
jgi:two-component system nitrogen regulation sensor histidine kinase NtrY